MDEYRTIRKASSDEFVEKKSRFIGHVCPVTTQEEAMEFIGAVKSKYWDATHNVYAYVLRDGQTRRYSDDGEPQGTAGIPVLDVLLKENVVDCAVVVTRYFGGIMLGAGGLVRAYSHGSKIALEAGGIVTMGLCDLVTVNCDYNFYGRVSMLIPEMGGIIENTEFTDTVKVDFRISTKLTKQLDDKIFDLSFGKYRTEITGKIFAAVD